MALITLEDEYGFVLADGVTAGLIAGGVPAESILVALHDYQGLFAIPLDDVVAFAPDAIVLIGFDETAYIIDDLAAHGYVPTH